MNTAAHIESATRGRTDHHSHHHDPDSAKLAVTREEAALRKDHAREQVLHSRLYAAGRLLLAALFIVSGVVKAFRFEATREALRNANLADARSLLFLAIAIEVLGGLSLAVGFRVRRAAVGLAVYLAGLTLVMHSDLRVDINRAAALANVSIIGGLLLLSAHGAGIFSLDRWADHRRRSTQLV